MVRSADDMRGARFNEAAAYHCGKPAWTCGSGGPMASFNEAAAYHCGKRERRRRAEARAQGASMRPQHITAENRTSLSGNAAGAMLQ